MMDLSQECMDYHAASLESIARVLRAGCADASADRVPVALRNIAETVEDAMIRGGRMPKPHDYRALLIRYIQHVRHAEGVDYITSGSHYQDDYFSAEEWRELGTLAAHECERTVADNGTAVIVIRPT